MPECPTELKQDIIAKRACRVCLLTPAYFEREEGYIPTWLIKHDNTIHPKLKAIAIQRPQVVSGWDLEKRGPKPTRRLAPAGTVLFLSFERTDKVEAIGDWCKDIWMKCISDNEQDRLDGFGLAVLGTWSGEAAKM